MGRKPVTEALKKTNFSIRIPKWQIDKLREIKNYNELLSKLITEYLNEQK